MEMSRKNRAKQRGRGRCVAKKTEENKEGNRGFYKLTNVRVYGLQRSLCMPMGSTLNAPMGCLFNAQWAEPNWAKRKRKGKGMRPKRDRDKHKSNSNP